MDSSVVKRQGEKRRALDVIQSALKLNYGTHFQISLSDINKDIFPTQTCLIYCLPCAIQRVFCVEHVFDRGSYGAV